MPDDSPTKDDARAAARLATLCVENGFYEPALEHARRLLSIVERLDGRPARAATLAFIGSVHNDLRQPIEAEHWLRESITFDARDACTWFNLANALADQKRYPEALEAARRAVSLCPDSGPYRVRLGSLLSDHVGKAEGRAEIEHGVRLIDARSHPTRFERLWRWIAAHLLDDRAAVGRLERVLFAPETVH